MQRTSETTVTNEDQTAKPAPDPTTTDTEQPASTDADAEQPVDSEPAAARPGLVQRFGVPAVALGITTALLFVFGAVMTGLYVRESNVRANRDGRLATKTAEAKAAHADLERAMADSADLRAKLKTAEDKILDPKGYELIKDCVKTQAMFDRALNEALANGGGNVTFGQFADGPITLARPGEISTACMEAEKYLK